MSHIQLRIDPEEKKQAQEILKSMGLTLSGSIKLFLKEVIKQRRLPFEISAMAPPPQSFQQTPIQQAPPQMMNDQMPPGNFQPPVEPEATDPNAPQLDPPVRTWNPFQQRRIG